MLGDVPARAERSAVLVTGGAGFLGTYVTAELAQFGRRVVAYDVTSPRPEALHVVTPVKGNVIFASGQITDLSRLLWTCDRHGVGSIVHAAGFTAVGGSVEEPFQTYKVNTEGTLVVLEAARLLGLGRVVLVSTNAVYQDKEREPIDETHPVVSIEKGSVGAHYGASKLAAEIAGLTYMTFNAVDVVVVRLSAIYGFGMQLPLYVKPMVEGVVRGQVVHFGSGAEMRRDYTYVRDAARGISSALEAPLLHGAPRIFNISGGQTHSAGEVAETVRRLVPDADITIGPGLNPQEILDMKTRGALDGTRARQAFGFEPAFGLEAGLLDYIHLLREYLACIITTKERHHA